MVTGTLPNFTWSAEGNELLKYSTGNLTVDLVLTDIIGDTTLDLYAVNIVSSGRYNVSNCLHLIWQHFV